MAHKSVGIPSAAATRLQTLESLVLVMMGAVIEQLPAFADRFCAALSNWSEQKGRPKEAKIALSAANTLKKNALLFQRTFLATMSTALLREVALLLALPSQPEQPCSAASPIDQVQHDSAQVSPEETENRALIGSISQSIELKNSSALVALNFRLGRVLDQPDLSMSRNPFRPALCVRAVFDSWCEFYPIVESHRLALRIIQPDVFFDFEPVMAAMNAALEAQGIVPDMTDTYRRSRPPHPSYPSHVMRPRDAAAMQNAEIPLQEKIQRWLQNTENGASHRVFAASPLQRRSTPQQHGDFAAVSLASDALLAGGSSALVTLRDVARNAPAGRFDATDYNTIELLARIFDFIFADEQIPPQIKNLVRHLQLPLLQTAFRDKAFFQMQSHPARRLLDQLIESSLCASIPVHLNDPLYKIIEQIVDRIQHEFNQQIGMYGDVVANLAAYQTADLTSELTSFLDDQQRVAEAAVQSHINDALHEEKMRCAQAAAASDIAARIESGEVAGFVEQFLESQWLRVLTLTHSVADRRPKALANARNAMDELIWSVKPKTSAADRAALIRKLPAILSLINAWLNLIKWNELARATFFSKLVERHAAIVQQAVECSPRRQLHLAVNAAQKASERRLTRRARELNANPALQFADLVDSVKAGAWIEFTRHDGSSAIFRLVWVSPLRSRFIFCSRQNDAPFLWTADELATALRDQSASLLSQESLTTRALSAALQHMDESN